jgi:prepilin-type N-terminal cleavage/methylation domain-containing protein
MSVNDSNEAAMTHLRAMLYSGQAHVLDMRYGGQARGFTIIELLVAMTITVLIAGAIAGVAPRARAAFDRVPADLDLQQRGRTGIDILSQAIRSAGNNVAATEALGALADLLPTVSVSGEEEPGTFTELIVILPLPNPAQGTLDSDQPSPGSGMMLATAPCPNIDDVCGFSPGSTAVVANGAGQFDVFSIAATDAGTRQLTPARALSRSYPAGSVLVEADRFLFNLRQQPDGSYSLVRTTAAGAVQPIVDFVHGLGFEVTGRTVAAGFYQIEQVDVWLSVEAQSDTLRRVIPDRVFRTSVRLRNTP